MNNKKVIWRPKLSQFTCNTLYILWDQKRNWEFQPWFGLIEYSTEGGIYNIKFYI